MRPAKVLYDARTAFQPSPVPQMQDSLERWRRLLHPKEWLKFMAENVTLPRWLVICVVGGVLPGIFGLLVGAGVFLWTISNQITRIDERGVAQERAIQANARQGLLNDEHERQLENAFAEFNGWQRGRAGEQYHPPSPRRDDRNDQPQQ